MKYGDVELIERTLKGDQHAFTALVDKYQDQIHTLVWQKIGDFHIAQEITQDVFITAYQKLGTLKKPNRFVRWLYAITNRKCITWYRKKKPQPQSLENTDPMELEEAYYSEHVTREREEATNENRRAAVHKLLGKLRENDRTVITLHYLTGLSCEEIGRFLGVSTNTVKSRLHRARNRLKKEEAMIQEILGGFQFPTGLTANVMKEISHLIPIAPSSVSSPLIPLTITAVVSISFVLLIGIGMQYYPDSQKTDSLNPPSNRGNAQLNQASDAQQLTRWGLPEGAIARLGKGAVNEIKYSPDGKLLAAATYAGIWLYDAETTQELALIDEDASQYSVAFSPDGKTIACGIKLASIGLWDIDTRTVKSTISRHGEWSYIYSIVFSPNGRTLATGSVHGVRLYDVDIGELIATLQENKERTTSVVFSPDGQTVASGNADNIIRLWDVNTGTLTSKLTGHTHEIMSVALSLDGKTVASGSMDNTVRLWDVDTGKLKVTLKGHKGWVTSLSFSPDGKMLASGSLDKTVHLWDVKSGIDLQTTPIDTYVGEDTLADTSVEFSPDGETLAIATNDGTIRVWKIDTREDIRTFREHIYIISSVAFSPDGETVASTSDTTVRLYQVNTATYKKPLVGHKGYVTSADFSPDGKILASGSQDKTILLWDVTTGKQKSMLMAHTEMIQSVIFSPDGRMLASCGDDKTVRLWDVATGNHKATLTGHTDAVLSVVFSPDGKLLVSGGKDTNIRLWDVATGNHHATLTGHTDSVNALAFSPDGVLASGSDDRTARLWDVVTSKQIASFTGLMLEVDSVSLSRDGQTLACGSINNIVLWDVSTKTHITDIKGHWHGYISMAFSPNGNMLASGSYDGVVYLWDLNAFVKPSEN